MSTNATANSPKPVARPISTRPARENSAEAAIVARRPMTSASPPVGSSRATTAMEWIAMTSPTVATSMPRWSISRTMGAPISPAGSQARKLTSA
ncbi:hypothetical protein ACFMQL_05855 [Nonomuraea fastidiosa]|uniref:hypothetical protein n=1 Tax=Nonomuraea fastidiosa TaxID=46173 RepID=UPI00366D53C4